MKEVVKVLEVGAVPAKQDVLFVHDMDGKWYRFKSTPDCQTYKEAIEQGKREEVSSGYAKSHVWPVSFGAGSLKIVFGVEVVRDNTFNREIRHV